MRTVLILFCYLIGISVGQTQVLACLDEVTVKLDDTDRATIFAIDLLEGESLMNENYIISLDGEESDVSKIDLFVPEIGTHTYTITDRATQNMCWGTLVVSGKNNFAPLAICSNTIPLNLDDTNRVSLSDINVGSFDDNTAVEDLIITISREGNTQLNPGDEQFVLVNSLTFSEAEICELVPVFMIVWDADGLRNTCLTEIAVSNNVSDCDFSSNAFNCPLDQIFYVDVNQDVELISQDFLFNPNLNGSFSISIDDADFVKSYVVSIDDIGAHTFSIKSDTEIIVCSGTFSIEEICTSDPCPNQIGFKDYSVKPGDKICVSAVGLTNSSLASIQTGILWDPSVLKYSRIVETGTLKGITVNEENVGQGELKFLWLLNFGDDPVTGEIGFDICFDVLGEAGESTSITFGNLPNFRIEAATEEGLILPLILNSGNVCIADSETECGTVERPEVLSGEIPLFIHPSNVDKEDAVIQFTLNGQTTNVYDKGTYGLKISDILQGTNELAISSSSKSSVLNGVSTLDIVMALQYVLGLEDLQPEQIIAADIDKSGDVSLTNDISHLNNLILGIETDIKGENWFFIPYKRILDQSFDGFNFTNDFSSYSFQNSEIDESGIDVNVYKYGDLSNNFAINRSTEKGLIEIDNELISANSSSPIKVKLSSEEIESFVGAQACLKLSEASIVKIEHEYGSSFSYYIQGDQIKFNWASGEAIENIEFIIHVQTEKEGMTSDFISLDPTFQTEYITRDLQVFGIDLKLNQTTTSIIDVSDSQFSIYPNPATDNFSIDVKASQLGKELLIYNALGQIEYTQKIKQTKSQIMTDQLSSGIKFISLEGSRSQKLMIDK